MEVSTSDVKVLVSMGSSETSEESEAELRDTDVSFGEESEKSEESEESEAEFLGSETSEESEESDVSFGSSDQASLKALVLPPLISEEFMLNVYSATFYVPETQPAEYAPVQEPTLAPVPMVRTLSMEVAYNSAELEQQQPPDARVKKQRVLLGRIRWAAHIASQTLMRKRNTGRNRASTI
jgi:hypothetical protein